MISMAVATPAEHRSALSRLVNPATEVAPPTARALLDELRRLSNTAAEISRNYGRTRHERRQRELVALHVGIRDLHEKLATHLGVTGN